MTFWAPAPLPVSIEGMAAYERPRDTLAFRKILVRGVCVTACCMKKIAIYECLRAALAFRKILVRDARALLLHWRLCGCALRREDMVLKRVLYDNICIIVLLVV